MIPRMARSALANLSKEPEKNEAAAPAGRPAGVVGGAVRSESLARDPRRDAAQYAVKARWASWAAKKAL